jgi:hypothetical protein
MNRLLLNIELRLAKLLVMSSSILWYPIISSGIKLHHILIILLAFLGTISGNLIKHFIYSLHKTPFFILFITFWFCTLLVYTAIYDSSWDFIKVVSFYLMIIISNYAIYILISREGAESILKLLNQSLIIFLFVFIFLTGLAPFEVFEIIYKAVSNADPKIIIFGFFGNAPIFLELSEDGLDGLRHTISFYLVLICLCNFIFSKKSLHTFIGIFIIFLILVLQSRSAWLSLGLVLPFIFINKIPYVKFSIFKWAGLFLIIVPTFLASLVKIIPLVFNRLFEATDSYDGRLLRLSEAWNLLAQFNFIPATNQRDFSSSHMFIFDSYFSGGMLGFISAFLIICSIFSMVFTKKLILVRKFPLPYLLVIPILVRFFTAGNGLPGIGAVLMFSVAYFYRYFSPRHAND